MTTTTKMIENMRARRAAEAAQERSRRECDHHFGSETTYSQGGETVSECSCRRCGASRKNALSGADQFGRRIRTITIDGKVQGEPVVAFRHGVPQ